MNTAMTNARARRRSARVSMTVGRLATVALIGAGLASACSGTPTDDTAGAPSASASSTSSKASSSATSKPTTKSGTPASGVGARADLADFSCEAASSGVWSAKGTLHNATGSAVKYSVMVSLASTKTSTVVGSVTKSVTLEAGKSEPFTVDQVAVHKGGSVACTAHVVRAPAS